MDFILRDYQIDEIKEKMDEVFTIAEDTNQNYATRLGTVLGYLDLIKIIVDAATEDVIGTTGVIWQKGDVIQAFDERLGRKPTDEELNHICKDILSLNGVGESECIATGWECISEALDEFEKEQKDEQ